MSLKNITVGILFLTLSVGQVKAQDFHFTQWYAAPVAMNPAETGSIVGDWRVTSIVRQQWRAVAAIPYNSMTFGFDMPLEVFGQRVGVGLQILGDESGPNALNVTKVYGSASYAKFIGSHEIMGGVQFGLISKGADISQLTFPNQLDWGIGQFNNTLSNEESALENSQFAYADINVGALFKMTHKWSPQFGISWMHMNLPKESFFQQDTRLRAKWSGSVVASIPVDEHLMIVPQLFTQVNNKASEIVAGGLVEYAVDSNKVGITGLFAGPSIRAGVARNFDALAITIGGVYDEKWRLGVAYDVNFSGLRQATNRRGAIEISLIYLAPSTKLTKYALPCDRL